MTSSEIKDKTDITNARKEIERRMERFKVVEKEAKTKSFSKEGLNRAAADPKERARMEMRDWLTSTVDTLNTQVGLRGRVDGLAGWQRRAERQDRAGQSRLMHSRKQEQRGKSGMEWWVLGGKAGPQCRAPAVLPAGEGFSPLLSLSRVDRFSTAARLPPPCLFSTHKSTLAPAPRLRSSRRRRRLLPPPRRARSRRRAWCTWRRASRGTASTSCAWSSCCACWTMTLCRVRGAGVCEQVGE